MFKVFICVTLLAVCSAQLIDGESYEPYAFGFNAADEWGTTWHRQEEADGSGAVRGSYGYTDAQGLRRIVEYIADPVNGFSANVISNEPGLISHSPAAVIYNVQ